MQANFRGLFVSPEMLSVFLLGIAASANAGSVLECASRDDKPPPVAGQVASESKLFPLISCSARIDDLSACNRFVGNALEKLYGNTDFKTGKDAYMLANDIANGLANSGNAGWRLLGAASNQTVLKTAQDLATAGKPVVATKSAAGNGHVALLLPGALEHYNADGHQWGDLKAPNSASFFLNHPERAFVGCPLSAVWRKPDGVILYTKP